VTLDVFPEVEMVDEAMLINKYSLVRGAARRARQLQSGAPMLGASKSLKACRVAQDEIRDGQVTFCVPVKKTVPPAAAA
jgi:DNA-directed RNA polymerase subunit omega